MLVLAHNLGIRDPKPAHGDTSTRDSPTQETAADADQPETARPPPPTA